MDVNSLAETVEVDQVEVNNTAIQVTLHICLSTNYTTGDFMKKVPTATSTIRDRYIVFIEEVHFIWNQLFCLLIILRLSMNVYELAME